MNDKIISILEAAVKKLGAEEKIELTPSKGHGDFSTNVAMKLARALKKAPVQIAQEIVANIDDELIEKAEVAGPGFINIFLSEKQTSNIVEEIINKGLDYGKGTQGKYINVEYVSANPTGYLHVGHARNAATGSTLVNILKFAGNKVDAEYYINDAGNQIDVLAMSVFTRYQELLGKDVTLPEDSYKGEDIIDVAKMFVEKYGDKFKDQTLEEVKDIFKEEATDILLNIIKEHLSKYGTEFDLFSSEKELHAGDKIERAIKKLDKHTYEKDGALWLDTTSKGDDKDRVLIKGDKKYTYFSPDIAYHDIKLSRKYDELINIWGADHIGYIKRMEVALNYLGLPSENLDIFTVQLVSLFKDGQALKMSKRKGTTYTLIELIEEIGSDAARWFMIDRSSNASFNFDITDALEQSSKNPVFNVQYTYARINQLLAKSDKKPKVGKYSDDEKTMINELRKFPELIDSIALNHKIHLLPQYLLDISGMYNSWYSNNKAIGSENEESMIALSKAVMIVIENGLKILGISTPKKM